MRLLVTYPSAAAYVEWYIRALIKYRGLQLRKNDELERLNMTTFAIPVQLSNARSDTDAFNDNTALTEYGLIRAPKSFTTADKAVLDITGSWLKKSSGKQKTSDMCNNDTN